MKVYLAALYSERERMEVIADALKALGMEIGSSWVYGGEEGLNRGEIAEMDLIGLEDCDVLLAFTKPRGTPTSGGRRHVEFGYALAKGIECIVIGDRENVFYHHPAVQVFATLEDWIHHMCIRPAEGAPKVRLVRGAL